MKDNQITTKEKLIKVKNGFVKIFKRCFSFIKKRKVATLVTICALLVVRAIPQVFS